MKKWVKIIIGIIAAPIVVVIILVGIWLVMNIQGVIEPFQIGNPKAEQKVLIASQGSEFKNRVLKKLVEQLKSEEIYVSVVDCKRMENVNFNSWDAIVIVHTSLIHEMPGYVKFNMRRIPDLSKVVMVMTSGGGDEVVTEFDVDAISTASQLAKTDTVANWTLSKVENILAERIR